MYRLQLTNRSANKIAMIKEQRHILRNIEGVKTPVVAYFMMKFLFYGFIKCLK